MNLLEKFLFFIGVVVTLLGFLWVAGVVGNMLSSENERSLVEWLFWMTFFGIVPMAGGLVLCRKVRRAGRERESEVLERTLLRLAQENQGHLTIAEASMNMSIASTEAKKLLDQCHLNSLADIEVSDSGAVIYRFKIRATGGG